MSTRILTIDGIGQIRITRGQRADQSTGGLTRTAQSRPRVAVEVLSMPGHIGEWTEISGRYSSVRSAVTAVAGFPLPQYKRAG